MSDTGGMWFDDLDVADPADVETDDLDDMEEPEFRVTDSGVEVLSPTDGSWGDWPPQIAEMVAWFYADEVGNTGGAFELRRKDGHPVVVGPLPEIPWLAVADSNQFVLLDGRRVAFRTIAPPPRPDLD